MDIMVKFYTLILGWVADLVTGPTVAHDEPEGRDSRKKLDEMPATINH